MSLSHSLTVYPLFPQFHEFAGHEIREVCCWYRLIIENFLLGTRDGPGLFAALAPRAINLEGECRFPMSLDMKAIVKVMNGDLLDCHCAIFCAYLCWDCLDLNNWEILWNISALSLWWFNRSCQACGSDLFSGTTVVHGTRYTRCSSRSKPRPNVVCPGWPRACEEWNPACTAMGPACQAKEAWKNLQLCLCFLNLFDIFSTSLFLKKTVIQYSFFISSSHDFSYFICGLHSACHCISLLQSPAHYSQLELVDVFERDTTPLRNRSKPLQSCRVWLTFLALKLASQMQLWGHRCRPTDPQRAELWDPWIRNWCFTSGKQLT